MSMTVERKIVVGLGDIKAIRFQCKKCGASISLTETNKFAMPLKCVACPVEFRSSVPTHHSALAEFSDAILNLRKFPNENCELLFEFDDPDATK
jgi:hypothetical protein